MKPTQSCPAFIEKLFLCCSDWSVISCWDAVPTQSIFLKLICSVNGSPNTPDRMELLANIFCLWTLLDELLNYLQFPIAASFKTTRIVKDKTRIALKYHLIFDVMLSTLWHEDIISNINTRTSNYLPSLMDQGRTTRSEITGMNVGIDELWHWLHLFTLRIEDYRFACSIADLS